MVNWVPHGPRQNHRVSDESRHLDARHTWPIGVWMCPDFCKSRPQLCVNSIGRVKGYRSKSGRVDGTRKQLELQSSRGRTTLIENPA